jgi:DNA-binding NarL/FixJ family response regulator
MTRDEPEAVERRLRILVVDDHDVVHWGFRLLFTQQPWVERCISARTGAEALALTRRFEPHVALVDLFIGDESGAEICGQLRAELLPPQVLFISGAGRISMAAARAAGASGFVSKDWPSTDIVEAVREVGAGGTVFAPQPQASDLALSDREREVLELMSSGATNREIADSLHLSPHTIKEHTSALFRKLDVRNRTEAVQRAQRVGLLD